MKQNLAIFFSERRKAVLQKTEVAFHPDPDELVARTLISVVSSGSECGGYLDLYGGEIYPKPTGYAGILEVEETGANVTRFHSGDIIFAQTSHQLYHCIKEKDVVAVPNGLDPEKAVFCRFPAVSMTSMIQTSIRPTEPVIVAGLGIVGLSCAQMLGICGYDVYAVEPMQSRREAAQTCNVTHVFSNYDALPAMPYGLSIDCTGRDDAIMKQAMLLRKGGELFLVGVPWRKISDDATLHAFMRVVFNGYLTVRSGWEWSIPLHSKDFLPNSNFHSFEKSLQWINEGKLRYDNIYRLYKPEECGFVYEAIATNSLPCTCAVFDWRGCTK